MSFWNIFGSLGTRLLAGFGLVILVTLFTAGSAMVWLIQDYQSRLAVDRLSEVAIAATLIGRQLEARDAQPEEIGSILSSQLLTERIGPVRVLVLDSGGRVVAEQPARPGSPDSSFQGRRLDVPASGQIPRWLTRQPFVRIRATIWRGSVEPSGRPFIFVSAPPGVAQAQAGPGARGPGGGTEGRAESLDRFLLRAAAYRIVLAVPERDLVSAWRELAPSLGIAFVVAVAAAVVVALLVSRSITGPLRRITAAAQAIARGNLRQTIPVRGRDEVARLASSFNLMSREVERSHDALRQFVADASHELRTPLTSIQGFSQALVEGEIQGDEGAAAAGEIIREESERMRRLVEDLLYLSRVESREAPATRVEVDVRSLLRDRVRRLEHVAAQRDLRLHLDLGATPDGLIVLGDADQLERVFGNVLENAGKYTPPGGEIGVSAAITGSTVEVKVHNTGTVIPEADQSKVFDRFYRIDKSRSRDVEGSGLGLAIAREVVERHGGTISVASSHEAGTTFTVTLPAASPAKADAGQRRSLVTQPISV